MPNRKPNRLPGYDYSRNGAYFLTICVKDRMNLLWKTNAAFSELNNPPLSDMGLIVEQAIKNIASIYPSVYVDIYVVMPNHIHMIIRVNRPVGKDSPSISTIVNQMKGYISKRIGRSIWQKLFHDHVIRNEDEYQKIWEYIDTNPVNWKDDCYHH